MSRALGIFGGTFDPIHLGHLRAAESAREALRLDEVAFVPARQPPHRGQPSSSALDRFAMVALATSGHPRFVACALELRRDGPSFTVDTVRALSQEHPQDRLVLIVGSDTFPEMEAWKDRGLIEARCDVAVVGRPVEDGTAADPAERVAQPLWRNEAVDRVPGPALPISSTQIRARAREGRSIRYLVPEAVADYIEKRGLYR